MQTFKEEIKNNILKAAKNEFLKNGFEKASVRTIAANAKTSKSNVYNYFADKDALFHAVVEPTVTIAQEGMVRLQSKNRQGNTYTIEAQKEVMSIFVRFAFDHSDNFKLLFIYSSGSSLSGFKNNLIESVADALENWVKIIAPGRGLSRFFFCSVAGFYISTIEQLIIGNTMIDQVSEHFGEFLKFVYGGWCNTLGISNHMGGEENHEV